MSKYILNLIDLKEDEQNLHMLSNITVEKIYSLCICFPC